MAQNVLHLLFTRSHDQPEHPGNTLKGVHSVVSQIQPKGVTCSLFLILAAILCQAHLTESLAPISCPAQCLCSNVTATPTVGIRPVLTIDCSNGSVHGFLVRMWNDNNDNSIANKSKSVGMSESSNDGGENESSKILESVANSNQESNNTLLLYGDGMETTNDHTGIINSLNSGEDLPDINLDLSFNNVSCLQTLGLFDWVAAPMVNMLNLSNNRIETVNSSYFEPFSNLVTLDLSNNVIENVTPRVFQHLSSLKFLYLHNNQIASIILKQQPLTVSSLTHLDLSHNRLLNLSAELFVAFPMISTLNLSENNIAIINKSAFTGLQNLRFLFLSKNNISSLNCPVFQNTSLASLWLNMNDLSYLGHNVFQGLTSLQYLNLNHNPKLHFLHYDIFSDLQSLEILDLSGNAIHRLSSLTFRNNPKLNNVLIEGLPLSCQCTNAWLAKSPSNSVIHNASQLQCFDSEKNQTVQIAETTFHCNNVSIPDIQSTLSVKIGSTLLLQCKQAFTADEDILIWTTPRGHVYYYHHFYPNASQHLLNPADVQLKAPFHEDHFWHHSSSYYSEWSSSDSRTQVLSDGSLFIDYVLRTDAGPYTCVVKNTHFNDSGTFVIHFSYTISGEVKLIACVVGILCALGFFTLNVIYVVISWLARRLINKRRREHIRQMLENLNSYKSTHITRIYENYSGQLTRVRNRYHVQRDRLHKNYTMQVERVKRGYSNQAEKVRDNYNNRLTQLREYSSCQIMQIREMATNQIGRIRDYGSLQLDRLRETYKLQHQHMMKLLDTMNLDNCRSIVETECMRTESMMYDLDLLSQEDVRMESPFSITDGEDSEYNTATSSPLLSFGSQQQINASSYQNIHNEAGDQYELAREKGIYDSDPRVDTGPEEILKVTRNSNEIHNEKEDDIQIEMNTLLHLPENVQLEAKEAWTYGKGDESTHTLYTKLTVPGELQQSCVEMDDQPVPQTDAPHERAAITSDKCKSTAPVSMPSIDFQQSHWDMGFMEQEDLPPPLFHCDSCEECATVHLYNSDVDEDEEEKTETDTMV